MKNVKKIKLSPQSVRLGKFVALTGYSVNAFAGECDIPSRSSLVEILEGGKSPSGKILDKIVKRFPQLNHDWVVLGYGEMIVKGIQKQPASANSISKSRAASFESINDNQVNHDFQLNELTNRIDKALVLQAQSTQLIQNQIMQMANTLDDKIMEWDKSAKESIGKFDSSCKQLPKDVQSSLEFFAEKSKKDWLVSFDKTKKEQEALIYKLDVERTIKIAKDTDKVAVKIINALNENTQKAINELKA